MKAGDKLCWNGKVGEDSCLTMHMTEKGGVKAMRFFEDGPFRKPYSFITDRSVFGDFCWVVAEINDLAAGKVIKRKAGYYSCTFHKPPLK